MEKEFFTLLRLGLSITTTEEEDLSNFIMLSSEQWSQLGDLARKQGVLGIMLDGVDKLEATSYDLTKELKAAQKLEWIGEVLQIEQRNHQQIVVMNDLAGKWKQQGCRVMVMKGQASATMYPKPEHRTPGDIDCYLFENYSIGNDISKLAGATVDESWYKHSVIYYRGEVFENHQYFVHTREGKRGKLLEKELEDTLARNVKCLNPLTKSTLLPPIQWTAMFLTYHACGHFVSEGLRLKQLLDWAMLLCNYQEEIDWEKFYVFCDKYHLRRFADAATAICVEHLGVIIRNTEIFTSSPYANRLLQDTLYGDDYVFNSGNNRWTNRLHLLKNLFRYRWKYEEICEDSIYKQLWYYVTGFIFKTER